MQEGLVEVIHLKPAVLGRFPDGLGNLLAGHAVMEVLHPVAQAGGIGGAVKKLAIKLGHKGGRRVRLHRQVGEIHLIDRAGLRKDDAQGGAGRPNGGNIRGTQFSYGIGPCC